MGPLNYAEPRHIGGVRDRVLALMREDPHRWWITKNIARRTKTNLKRASIVMRELFEEGVVIRQPALAVCRMPLEYRLREVMQ